MIVLNQKSKIVLDHVNVLFALELVQQTLTLVVMSSPLTTFWDQYHHCTVQTLMIVKELREKWWMLLLKEAFNLKIFCQILSAVLNF